MQHAARRCVRVEGHEVRRGVASRKALQLGHRVRDRDLIRGARRHVVPRRVEPRPARQERAIGVQHGRVVAVLERAERAALGGGGLGEQRERGVGVRREDQPVEALLAAGHDGDARRVARDGLHRAAEAEVEARAREQRVDVAPAAADDGLPRQRADEPQHAVLIEEAEVGQRGERAAPRGRERPQRRRERDREPRAQLAARAAHLEVLVERRLRDERAVEIAARLAQEAHHLDEEPPVAAVEQLPAICEQRGGAPLEIAVGDRDREAHRRRPGGDAELAEHPEEARVARAVADDEAHVDRQAVGVDRVDVPAGARGALVQRDLVPRRERAGGGQPRDTRTDDGDPHGRLSAALRPAPRRETGSGWSARCRDRRGARSPGRADRCAASRRGRSGSGSAAHG